VISPLRILLLEDDPADAGLIQEFLEADHFVCQITRVETRAEFLTALEGRQIDLILADYKLPSFDGLSALELALSIRSDLPFIFVSGTLGEEIAIEALKVGATDYVLKARLSRLAPSVRRALRETRGRAERTQAERTLREQANLLNLTHDAIFVHNMNGVITYWNRGAEALYGWAEDEARAKAAPELLRTAFPVPFELKDGRWQGELLRTRKDGTQVVVASRWSLQRDDAGEPVAILETNNDITERKRAEESVRRSEKELRDLIEAIPVIAFTTWPDGSNIWINRRWVEFSRLSLHETLGLGWQSTVHPADLDQNLEKWRHSVASGEPFENEARHRSGKGEYRWFLVRAVPLRDDQGKIVKWYGTLTDIEDRKRGEQERERLRQLEADLARMNRVSIMGELAASLDHEIKQPIGAAFMYAQACTEWLNRDPPKIEEARREASAMANALSRAAEISDRNRLLFRRQAVQREPIDLNELIREMVVLMHDVADSRSISIRTDLDAALSGAVGDRVQLHQVLMNLMLNGIEAMKGSGELRITSTRTENDQLLVSVTDSGIGLSGDDRERIFEAFYTTKPQGTGMGLSISRRIIESHGGRLWADRNPRAGRDLLVHAAERST
jgi:PAS domain S-box-containing protein